MSYVCVKIEKTVVSSQATENDEAEEGQFAFYAKADNTLGGKFMMHGLRFREAVLSLRVDATDGTRNLSTWQHELADNVAVIAVVI